MLMVPLLVASCPKTSSVESSLTACPDDLPHIDTIRSWLQLDQRACTVDLESSRSGFPIGRDDHAFLRRDHNLDTASGTDRRSLWVAWVTDGFSFPPSVLLSINLDQLDR